MNFGQFLLRRLFLMIIVLFGVACSVFFFAYVLPAVPVGASLGGNAPPEAVDRL
jgi:peptide/nickel transport system permease protein